ncbi:MAG TPA: hypothetical protein VK021_13725 [Flavobacteriaceae bacterium]|nr:hypothetical protein [Flavobacteriaceae bacterium]
MSKKEEIKAQILEIIENTKGNIKSDEIWEELTSQTDPGRTQETIRKYIRELVVEGGNLIGSSNKGYFKISTSEKITKAVSNLETRIPKLEERVNKLKESWNIQNPDSQI